MKIIISRKGFDWSNGGTPSPVMPDGTLLSMPIPSGDMDTLSTLYYKGNKYADIMNELKSSSRYRGMCVHVDPDIRRNNREFLPDDWAPAFGQIGIAQQHLKYQNVEVGDIFLFFGWFGKTQKKKGKLRYISGQKDLHIIWGYLQIGKIAQGKDCLEYHWHPHCYNFDNNTIYEASPKLVIDGEDTGLPGAGCLRYSDELVLTKPGETRSKWLLPDFFKEVNISCHTKDSFKPEGYFQSVRIGQEFVVSEDERVTKWAKKLILDNYDEYANEASTCMQQDAYAAKLTDIAGNKESNKFQVANEGMDGRYMEDWEERNRKIEELVSIGVDKNLAGKLVHLGYCLDSLKKASYDDLISLRGFGKKKVNEIMEIVQRNAGEAKESIDISFENIQSSDTLSDFFYKYVDEHDTDLYSLKPLSIYSINTFFDNDFNSFKDVVRLDIADIESFEPKSKTIVKELNKAKQFYYEENKEDILHFISETDDSILKKEKNPQNYSELKDWLKVNGYQEIFSEYLQYSNVKISEMGLSKRLANKLESSGILLLSDLILENPESIRKISGLGSGAYKEYEEYCNAWINKHLEEIISFCKKDSLEAKLDYYETILIRFLAGKSESIRLEGFPILTAGLQEEEIPAYLEHLKKSKRLSINKYGISMKLPSLSDLVEKLSDERQKGILLQRLSGKTLEESGKSFGLTRERARQIGKRGLDSVRALNLKLNGTRLFDEDKYVYLYENYLIIKKDFIECFELEEKGYYAIQELSKKRGIKVLDEDALDDPYLDDKLKTKIQRYLDKDVIKIRGQRIPIRKQDIRTYILRRECRNDTTIESFIEAHNDFLKAHKLEDRADLFIDRSQIRTIENVISSRNDVLWKQWSKFRYYDILSRDYDELLEELHLDSFENILISADKLQKENKTIMKKYDIRDGYELHNLIRKIYNTPALYNQYQRFFGNKEENAITFGRMPGLMFGSFDRDERVTNLMKELSPISSKELISILSKEHGFSETVIQANWVSCISPYLRWVNGHGEYSFEVKPMRPENMKKLSNSLVDYYYTFDEIRKIYSEVCPGEDPDEINSMNLKKMGYVVNSNYILTGGFASMKDYVDYLANKNDSVNVFRGKINDRILYDYFYSKQYDYEIIMYDKSHYVTLQKLEKFGITKLDLNKFAEEIESLVDGNEYFNYRTVKEKYGYHSVLDNLGFDDCFYNKVLEFSDRFAWSGALGTLVFRKNKEEDITKASFINALAKEQGQIEIDDFMTFIKDTYGTNDFARDDIVYLFDDSVYYNRILGMVFKDYETFSEYIEKN